MLGVGEQTREKLQLFEQYRQYLLHLCRGR